MFGTKPFIAGTLHFAFEKPQKGILSQSSMHLGCNIPFMSGTGDECRIIMFKEPIENKAMTGHVIRSEEVPNQGTCRLMCYMEPNCVSINFGPSEGGKYKCELNSASEDNKLAIIENRETFTFLAIEVTFSWYNGK